MVSDDTGFACRVTVPRRWPSPSVGLSWGRPASTGFDRYGEDVDRPLFRRQSRDRSDGRRFVVAAIKRDRSAVSAEPHLRRSDPWSRRPALAAEAHETALTVPTTDQL